MKNFSIRIIMFENFLVNLDWKWLSGILLTVFGIGLSIILYRKTKKKHTNQQACDKQVKSFRTIIKKIINEKNIFNEEQMQSISSQYFMIRLVEKLNLVHNKYYEPVINEFLSSLKYTEDGIALFDKNILITPKETRAMYLSARKEDEDDNYYAKIDEIHKAENIDFDVIHRNYLYGLIVSSSQSPKSRDTVKKKLLKEVNKKAVDYLMKSVQKDGGWYPYRMPWITARIIISLLSLNLTIKSINFFQKKKIKNIISGGIDSIIERVFNNHYWKDGTGGQVSKWESTGLCLEAIILSSRTEEFRNVILKSLNYAIQNEDKWLIKNMEFNKKDNVNKILSSVILVCVLLKIKHKLHINFELNETKEDEYLQYLHTVIHNLKNNQEGFIQHCTIPQILYYISDLADLYNG